MSPHNYDMLHSHGNYEQVNFLAKLMTLRPGDAVQKMIKNVMLGKDEGAEDMGSDGEESKIKGGGIAGRVSKIFNPHTLCAVWWRVT